MDSEVVVSVIEDRSVATLLLFQSKTAKPPKNPENSSAYFEESTLAGNSLILREILGKYPPRYFATVRGWFCWEYVNGRMYFYITYSALLPRLLLLV